MSSPLVTIIDYGMGNVGSVQNALEALGAIESVETVPIVLDRDFVPDRQRHEQYRAAQVRHRRFYQQLVGKA